ncbi:MAG: hypothetical protein BroJett003_19820 [Planctomycetota bacterium]|nr:MAG: hypothetical protein BroJett003_19820 [Planctomycetota bacterium]
MSTLSETEPPLPGTARTAFVTLNVDGLPSFGAFGFLSEYAGGRQASSVLPDDYPVGPGFPRESHGRRRLSVAWTAISSGAPNVRTKPSGREAVFSGHQDDAFIAEVRVRLNSGKDASLASA